MNVCARVLCVCALALAAGAAVGQVTTGALTGRVNDADGAALPGVSIEAVSQETGARYQGVTTAAGTFNLANARVGPYTVKAALEGFQPVEQPDVVVQLGKATSLDIRMQLATVSEEIEVIGASNPLISADRTGAASNVSLEQIETLPNIGRSIEEFARTNPFFAVASLDEGPESISVAGRNSRYNNIQIDGAVNNDLFGLADQGTPGGQANTTPISLDAIKEIQLVLADFDVRQGGFSGGSVNAITRSGTNDWNGSLFFFTRDEGLVGDGPDVLGEPGEFSEDQYGFRLGGPISRDRAFFFLNGELSEREEPTGWSLDGASGQAFAGGALANEAESFRSFLIDTYGFDPGSTAQVTRPTDSDKLFGRVDFNLAANHQLTLRHNYVDASNLINRPSSFSYEFPSEGYDFTNETNSTVAQFNSVLGSNQFNEFRVSYQAVKDRRTGVASPPFPWIEIEDEQDFEFEAGTEPFSTQNALDQDILELTNDFTWVAGSHTVTLGTHNEFFTFDNLFVQNSFGAYQFRTLADFEAGIARQYDFAFVNPGQPDSQKFDVQQIGLYAGDQWAVRPNLTLTYGLRLDVPYFPDQPSRNPFTESVYGLRTDEIPDGVELIQPRVGFNWDPEGDGRGQLRGGTGIFAGRTPYVWISNNYARTGIEQTFVQAFDVPFVADPFNQPTDVGGASFGEFNLIDPDFEFPQVWRTNLAYDRQLPWWNLVGSIEAIYGDSLEEIDYKDVNLRQVGTQFDGRPLYDRIDPAVTGAYLITNTSAGEATNLAVRLERPYGRGAWGYVSYAWGESKVINDGTSSRAVSNFQLTEAVDPNNVSESTSDFELEHRINAALSYRINRESRSPTTVSAFYNLQSGRPYTNIYGFQQFPSINGDRYFSNDPIYVPSGPDDVIITNGTFEQLDAYLRTEPCLSGNRGGIARRNCSSAPWNHSLDVHVAQEIPIGATSFDLTLDILNVVNLIDEDSGVLRFVPFSTVSPVDFLGVDEATGLPIYELNAIVTDPEGTPKFDIHNLNSRWRAKLGARWSF